MDPGTSQASSKGKQPLIPRADKSPVEDPEAESVAKRLKLMRENGCREDSLELMTKIPDMAFKPVEGGTDEKRTEGFLFKCRNGEVGIVCVCHDTFLNPTEFMEHAGGVDVDKPMKHITVCSGSSPF